MLLRSILTMIFSAALLMGCFGSSYESLFFMQKDLPPKIEVPLCKSELGRLAEGVDENLDFLLGQLMNDKSTGQDGSRFSYKYADVADHILTMHFGPISDYYHDFNYSRRLDVNDKDFLVYRRDVWVKIVNSDYVVRKGCVK